jgi:hypothetical protein
MKRFGLLTLLSASYAGLLLLIFSTDYSRENSFGFHPIQVHAPAKAFEAPVMADNSAIADHIQVLQSADQNVISDAGKGSSGEAQSPESAGSN